MKKGIAILLIAIVSLILFPKQSGGELCGPVCPPTGFQYWERQCIGFKYRDNYVDGFSDKCIGITVGERVCYGKIDKLTPVTQMSCPDSS